MDYPSSGPDYGKGVIYFTAYYDRVDIVERLVAILLAFISSRFGTTTTKAWFHPGSLEAIGEVTFGHDNEGNWNGTWSTTEDELAQDILEEDLGIALEFENLPDIETQMVLLTADEASVETFGTALAANAPP